jgi:uncharacterized protein
VTAGSGGCLDSFVMALHGVPAYLVQEIPRREDAHREGGETRGARGASDAGRGERVGALVAAYHAGTAGNGVGSGSGSAGFPGAVGFGWVRGAVGGAVRVVAAGESLAGSGDGAAGGDGGGGDGGGGDGGGGVLLALPRGARAVPLGPGGVAGVASELGSWREIGAICDGLLTAGGPGYGSPGGGGGRGSGGWGSGGWGSGGWGGAAGTLDDGLLGSWAGAFGWFVVAEPLALAELLALAEAAGRQERQAAAGADRFPDLAARAQRLKQRHAELQRGVSSGFWRITLVAGGTDAASAARIAGLLCAAADLDGLPYALSPALLPAGRAQRPEEPLGDAFPVSPFYGSTEMLAALARPPVTEIPGVRFALRPEFDVTPEIQADSRHRERINLGAVLDRNLRPAGPFTLAADSLNRHVFVSGATGAGKSQTVRSLLEAVTARGIPWLVVEPAKAEYRLMASRLPGTEVIVIRPGAPDAIAAGLNPLAPAVMRDGTAFPLQTHSDLVKALFVASFQAEEPFPQVLSAALGRVYEQAGWDLALGEPLTPEAAYPTLTALQRAAEQVVAEIGYSQRVTDDVLGFIKVRLASLRHGTTGRFLEGGHPLDFGALLRSNVVLEIEDVGDDADKAFLMGTVLIRLAEHLRLTHRTAPATRSQGLAHLTVIEEAHRLLRRSESAGAGGGQGGGHGAAGHAVELFAGLLAEIRAYGEGLVIAEQIPARLVPDVIKNTAVKITHRLPAADDREAVGATMNATPAQSRYLVTLPPGQAAVFADGMDYPVLVKITDGTERERAAPVQTADPRSVVHPRSATCGGNCDARPCTLRDIRRAQRVLEEIPWLPAWAELGVLAHLTGWPLPVPTPAALAAFRALPARLRECALSHAVDAAVLARPSLNRPGALAVHLAAAISARAVRQQWLCRPDEPEWLQPETDPGDVAFDRPGLLADFIDCEWLGYPPGGRPPVPPDVPARQA